MEMLVLNKYKEIKWSKKITILPIQLTDNRYVFHKSFAIYDKAQISYIDKNDDDLVLLGAGDFTIEFIDLSLFPTQS